MTRAIVISLVLAAAGAAAAGTARAGGAQAGDKAEARRLAARAQVHFDLGEYGLAIVDYREAYRRHPSPGLIYNLAQAYRLSGDCVSATVMYRNFLRLAKRSPYRSVARQHISQLAECNRQNTGWAAVDDSFVSAATAKGTASLEIAGATDQPADGGRARPGRSRKRTGLALGIGGAGLVAVGAFFSMRAEDAADEVSRRYGDGEDWDEIEPLDRRGRRDEILGATSLVAGGVALATGATLYALGWREDRRAAAVTVAPAGKGAAVSLTWGF